MKKPEVRVKNSRPFKLKDKPSRQYVGVNILKEFGFAPEVIIIEKVIGHTNTFYLRAVLTPEEIKREDARINNLKQENDKPSTTENSA